MVRMQLHDCTDHTNHTDSVGLRADYVTMLSTVQRRTISLMLFVFCNVTRLSESTAELPHCVESNKESGFVLISTLDGKLTSIDSHGFVLWDLDVGSSSNPLLASSIHNVELTNNGEWVRIIPSLTGSLYKFNGKTIDAIPISADSLLKSSFMYSNDLVIAGGRDIQTFGVAAKSGNIIYECSSHGCINKTNLEDEFEDIVVVERSSTTVRAHEPRTGVERWNFSVGYHNVKIPQANCLNFDSTMHNLNFTVVMPKGLLIASAKHQGVVWQHIFMAPIVKVWKWNGMELNDLDLFIPIKTTQTSSALSPAIYLGMHNKQLYIQESTRMINALQFQLHQPTEIVDTNSLTHIPWKPISATEFEDNHDDSTALSVLYSSEYINGNGYYFYTDLDILCYGNATKRGFERIIPAQLQFLQFYWKEIILVTLTAIIVNICWKYGPIQRRSDVHLIKPELGSSNSDSASTRANLFPYSLQSDSDIFISRYVKDFDTVRCLGRGGYGVVFEVKQKIDECGYAIKRITLSDKHTSQQRVLREVKALAKLDHPNIVRYCTSWVECPPLGWISDNDKMWTRGHSSTYVDSTVISISDDITFERDVLPSGHVEMCESSQESASTSAHYSKTTSNTDLHPSLKSHNECAYLYIQMQLCKKESLKDWLSINTIRQRSVVVNIFNQVLSAVEYIHAQKLIHRDLKPSNIFFSQEDYIKVGDFGLVTTMQSMETGNLQVSSVRNHTKGAGTYLYMSPEQTDGSEYDYRVDIFSLGIILFELLVSFLTEMERVNTLSNLRHNHYPEKFASSHPKEHELLKKMLSKDPQDRPSACDVKAIISRNCFIE